MPFDGNLSRPKPMPHQITGAAFLAARGFALLADEAGAGKSPQVVIAADLCGARRILMVCPAVVRRHWEKVFLDWQEIDRPVDVVEGNVKSPPGEGVTIVSHAAFADAASVRLMFQSAPYDIVAIDEIHFMRQMDAARTRAILGPDGAWAWVVRFWGLSGTPLVNSAADLWPLTYGPMRMQVPWWDWGQHFAAETRQDSYGGIRFVGLKNAHDLAAILRPHVLRRTLEGVGVKLPPLTIASLPVAVDLAALNRVMADLEGWTPQRLAIALEDKDELHDSALARVRKALGLAKAEQVARHVGQMLGGGEGPVVVFFQHTAVREALFAALQAKGFIGSWVDGKVTKVQLGAAIDWFQGGRLDYLLVQTDAGGIGISLTKANRAVVAELPWTAVGLWQAAKRISRIGQSRACLVEVVRAHGCWLEDALASAVQRKHVASQSLLSLLESFE
jgi:SNF2 family DNA or RNA helicase